MSNKIMEIYCNQPDYTTKEKIDSVIYQLDCEIATLESTLDYAIKLKARLLLRKEELKESK